MMRCVCSIMRCVLYDEVCRMCRMCAFVLLGRNHLSYHYHPALHTQGGRFVQFGPVSTCSILLYPPPIAQPPHIPRACLYRTLTLFYDMYSHRQAGLGRSAPCDF